MHRLRVRGFDGTQQDYPLAEATASIGRDPASTICLKDSQVSWKHAVVVRTPAGYAIEDLRSSNGTFLGKQRIERHELSLGEVVTIGPYELILEPPHARTPTGAIDFTRLHMPSPLSASERTVFGAAAHFKVRAPAPPQASKTEDSSPTSTATIRTLGWLSAIRHLAPIVEWSASYRRPDLRHDTVAGLTVAALMIPQGMAYALLAGLPPAMGLYASILPMIMYAIAGSGRQTSVGPVTVDSLMMVLGLGAIAAAGSSSYIALALLLTLGIGVIQLSMGVLRLGFLVNFLSYPVLAGFTSAIAIITAFDQLKHLLGIEQPHYTNLIEAAANAAARLGQTNASTLTLGLAGIAAIAALRRWAPQVPGPLTVLIVSTVLTYALGLNAHGVSVLGDVQRGLPHFGVPAVEWTTLKEILPLALTMSLVSFAQTISVGKALGNKYGYDVEANRELTALGLSNIASSFSQGYAVSGSLARSALNAEAGAKTPIAAIVCALSVGAITLFLTPLFHYVPHATLAAILIVSAVRLIDTREIRYLFKVKVTEGCLLVFTIATTLVAGIIPGLLAGVIASILLFITLNTRPSMAILGRLPNTNIFRNVEHFPEAQTIPGLVIVRIDASLYFANVEFLKETIHEICARHGAGLKAILLDGSAVNDLDSSADTALHQLSAELTKKGIDFYIAGIKAPVRDVMRRSGLYERLGGDHFFFTIDAAVKRFQEKNRKV